MKICFVTANLGPGGAERVISLLANQFFQRGYDVEIVFFRDRQIFYKLDDGIKVIVLGEECHSNALCWKMLWLRRYVNKIKPQIIIPFRVSVYCTTIFSLLGISVPIVASERIDPHIPDSYWTILRKLLLPFIKHLVVQTEYIKSYYPRFIQKRTTVIHNPVRDEVFEEESGEKREEKKQNRIISVGRLYPQKNQKMMIRAFAQIADKYPGWKLVIFGEGPLRAQLEFLVSSFGLQDRVLLPGRTEHVIEELRNSKVFCFSSDFEGLSNSLIEALCVGLPIVTTNVSGTEDILVEEENGLVVPVNDEQAMAQALERLLSDEQLMDEMGKHSRQKAAMFSMITIYSQWERLIKSIAKNGN